MLKLAALFVPGFEVRGLWPAFWGGLILSLLNLTVRQVLLAEVGMCRPYRAPELLPLGFPTASALG